MPTIAHSEYVWRKGSEGPLERCPAIEQVSNWVYVPQGAAWPKRRTRKRAVEGSCGWVVEAMTELGFLKTRKVSCFGLLSQIRLF